MPNIVGVVFHKGGKVYDFDAGTLELARGDQVVVETVRGTELGTVAVAPREAEETESAAPLKAVLRRATAQDLETLASHSALRTEALATCRKLIAKHGLEMKLVDAEVMFGGGKIVISFFAEERIDFRALVVDLAKALKMRIELRQIGVRDEARMFGGLGPCGRHLCCTLFQVDQEPVSIRMAKEQNLPLNPMKISGLCGRLMCCLKYEQEQYVAFRKEAPRRGTPVSCPKGEGVVAGYQVPKDSIVIKLADGTFVEEKADLVRLVGAERCCGGEAISAVGGAEPGGEPVGGELVGGATASEVAPPAPEAPEAAMAAGEELGAPSDAGAATCEASGAAEAGSGGSPETELRGTAAGAADAASAAGRAAEIGAEAPAFGGVVDDGATVSDGAEMGKGARSGERGSRRGRRDRGTADREGSRGGVAEEGARLPGDRREAGPAAERAGEEPTEGAATEPSEKKRSRRRRRRSKSRRPGAAGAEGSPSVGGGTGGGSGGGSDPGSTDE